MKVIGITGSSGSGKTTVAKIIKENYNCKLIICDDVVKQESAIGKDYYNAIFNCFGESILDNKKNINKKKLANIIYSNIDDRKKLNLLTTRYIVPKIKELIDSTFDFVIIDAPLLFECNVDKLCNVVISVISKNELKISRICKRDNIDRQTAINRLKIQPSNEFYIEKSDYIIENNGENLGEIICTIIGKI